MTYTIRIEQSPASPLAVVRRQASKPQLGAVIQEACGTVWSILRSQKVPGAGRHVTVYLGRSRTPCVTDDAHEDFNLEVGVELTQPFAGHGEVIASSLPVGEVATTTHLGPYQLLPDAHDAIQKWCADSGREPIRPCWETYGHWLDDWNNDPSKIRTDVYYLLKPGS
jgi:effector-binding domain-containing protein